MRKLQLNFVFPLHRLCYVFFLSKRFSPTIYSSWNYFIQNDVTNVFKTSLIKFAPSKFLSRACTLTQLFIWVLENSVYFDIRNALNWFSALISVLLFWPIFVHISILIVFYLCSFDWNFRIGLSEMTWVLGRKWSSVRCDIPLFLALFRYIILEFGSGAHLWTVTSIGHADEGIGSFF